MMTRLVIELEDGSVDFHRGPQLQGVMFEHLDNEYADWLHVQQIHPYSQYGYKTRDGASEWVINVLNDEAYNYIIAPLLKSDFREIRFRGTDKPIEIVSKKVMNTDEKTMWKDSRNTSDDGNIAIDFLTPTAFKQAGHYVMIPDLRLIYQNLVMRYAPMAEDSEQYNVALINELVESTQLTGYRLYTERFRIGKSIISGFMGRLNLRIIGTVDIRVLARFLFHFGEYSGIGIKVGMGMGAIRVV